jgi:hypothetical protein
MINLNDLTLGQIKEIKNLIGNNEMSANHPYQIGMSYFIRTVTHYYTGRLIAVYENELVLEDAAWIPDTGRYSDLFKTGKPAEVEPLDEPVIIGRKSIIDCNPWKLILPQEQI